MNKSKKINIINELYNAIKAGSTGKPVGESGKSIALITIY